MCGEVAREVLLLIGESPDHIGLMSIGDVDLPDFAREVARQMMESAHEHHSALVEEEGFGYDLSSKGSERARESMIKYFDRHYGFSEVPGLMEKLSFNATIVGGGMRGLDDIATAMVSIAEAESTPEKPKKHRFIHPDNSFGTWHSIVDLRSNKGKTAEVHKVPTDQKNLLHLSPEQVDEFYEANPIDDAHNDSWCITPVGNPSGTYIDADALAESCKRIVKHNPKVKIILDCTYVRTLKPEISKKLVAGIIGDPQVLDRVVFIESFSKTHGFSGERLGTYFSANPDIYNGIQNLNMMLSAGNGRQKSALVLALTNPTDEQEAKIGELHEFWARERKGLCAYLLKSGNFGELFEEDQTHITEEQMDSPLGLYVLIKLKPGITRNKVLEETGCLGVETKMSSGNYIRFSVGKIKTPTYAKYLTNQ
jgi:aspartate/methionine/tyrosine aminotransferase